MPCKVVWVGLDFHGIDIYPGGPYTRVTEVGAITPWGIFYQ